MNHLPSHMITGESRPLTRRAIAKLRTRQALLAAGKQLFAERGYEAATVRDIASAAGMSTGAVFANFSDKADLFSEILAADLETLGAAMRQAAQGPASLSKTLVALFAAGYDFHTQQLPLFQAAQAWSWTHDAKAEARSRASLRQITAMVQDILRRAVERRELHAGVDIDLMADLLWQAYLSNYRLAVFDGFTPEQLVRRLERQIELILKSGQA